MSTWIGGRLDKRILPVKQSPLPGVRSDMTMAGVFNKADHGNARFRWRSPCAMDSFCWLCRGIWIKR